MRKPLPGTQHVRDLHEPANSGPAQYLPAIAALVLFSFVSVAAAQPAAAPDTAGSKRPKVGLVLSGGGARGLTHIGVLKVLHEMRIPIDYIAGTSMGAIVAGLYASGMTPEQMQQHLGAVSWPTLLSDSPPRADLYFRRKEEEAAFPLAFELGYNEGRIQWFKGALSGSNLELFLHELTRNYDAVDDFDKLPIPYRAVATNMVTGKEVVFDHGRLYQAMRASMSVPGMFSPVEIDGRILGDGGLVNNLPVDIVKAMGADIVIAVNIGTPLMSRDQLQSVVGFASQMLNILTEQNVRVQLALLGPKDILISPDLGNLTFLDFRQAPKFVELGTAAAEAMRPQLAALADSSPEYAQYERRFIVPPEAPPKKLDFVTVEGTQHANPEALEAQMQTKPDEPFSMKRLESDLAHLYGHGDLESIDYQLMRVGSQEGLVVTVAEKPWGPNYLRFGVSLSSDLQGDSFFNALAGHKRVWVNSLGAEWSNEVVLGSTRRYATEFYQPLNLGSSVFASGYGTIQRAPQYFFSGDIREATYDTLTETAALDAGVPIGTSGEVRGGAIWVHQRADPAVADTTTIYKMVKMTEAGAHVLVRWDTLDNSHFPRRGIRINGDAFWGNRQSYYENVLIYDGPSSRMGVYANAAFPLAEKLFLNAAVRAGGITNSADKRDFIQDFSLGGFLNLSGLRTDQLSNNYLLFGRVVGYYQVGNMPLLGRGVYVGGSLEAGNVYNDWPQVSLVHMRTAGSVFFAADTWLGPFYFAYGLASGGQHSFYVYLGRI